MTAPAHQPEQATEEAKKPWWHPSRWPQGLVMALLGAYPYLEEDELKEQWDALKPEEKPYVLWSLEYDFAERTGTLRGVAQNINVAFTVLAVLLVGFGLAKQQGYAAVLINLFGVWMVAWAIVVLIWSYVPAYRVLWTDYEDPGKWALGIRNDYDKFKRLRQDVSNRNHIAQRAKRLHLVALHFNIASVLLVAAAFTANALDELMLLLLVI